MSPMHDRCAWVTKQLPIYIDGELSRELAAGVADHLERCSACRATLKKEIEEIECTVSALVGAEPDRTRTVHWRQPSVTTRGRESLARPRTSRRRRVFDWGVSLASAAALLLLGVTTTWLWQPQDSTHDDSTDRHASARRTPAPADAKNVASDATAKPGPTDSRTVAGLPEAPTAPLRPGLEKAGPSSESIESGTVESRTIESRTIESGTIEAGTEAEAGGFEIVLGDMNADGELTFADLRLFLHALEVGFDAVPCAAAGDFDGDAQLTPLDSILASRSLGLHGGTPAPRLFTEIAANGPLDCLVMACP